MPFKNSKTHYGSFTIGLHWLFAFLIIVMIILGYAMSGHFAIMIHKSIGLVLFVLAVIRIVWIHINPGPAYPDFISTLEKRAAITTKYFIYVCLIAMPITGWILQRPRVIRLISLA